jgi:DNA-directed RNA polymerase
MEGSNDRKIVKRPVMSFFYGSEPGGFSKKNGRWVAYGMTKQILDILKDRQKNGQLSASINIYAGAKKLAKAIFKTIGGMVPRAKEVRDRLRQLAKLCAKENKPLRWTTPLGLPVQNRYHLPEIETIRTPLNRRYRRTNVVVDDKEDIDGEKAVNSVAANFVHSVDAAHLQLVALAAAKEGISMVSVHDCFGCLAPHAKRFNEIIREQFVWLHEHDLLAEVWESARRDLSAASKKRLPPIPERGNLELEQVLESYFAFS